MRTSIDIREDRHEDALGVLRRALMAGTAWRASWKKSPGVSPADASGASGGVADGSDNRSASEASQRNAELRKPSAKGTQSYHSRAAARFERYRVELVSPDSDMTTLAEAAVASLGDIHRAESKEDMEQRAEHTRKLIEQFVAAGAPRPGS